MFKKAFRLIFTLLFLFPSVLSCAKDTTAAAISATPVITQQSVSDLLPLDPPTDPDIVSNLAVCDYLPIDDYSWIREYPAEFVMLHFSSNVVINKKDPYSLAGVRKIFEDSFVSANYVIDRDGTVYCWIPEQRAAWHAGKGTWLDDEKYENKMNKYSIGIEMLAIGSKNDMKQYLTSKEYNSLPKELIGYTDAQYESLIKLLKDITYRWNIPCDRQHIIGHEEYKPEKCDPGELFDWNRVMSGLQKHKAENGSSALCFCHTVKSAK